MSSDNQDETEEESVALSVHDGQNCERNNSEAGGGSGVTQVP